MPSADASRSAAYRCALLTPSLLVLFLFFTSPRVFARFLAALIGAPCRARSGAAGLSLGVEVAIPSRPLKDEGGALAAGAAASEDAVLDRPGWDGL